MLHEVSVSVSHDGVVARAAARIRRRSKYMCCCISRTSIHPSHIDISPSVAGEIAVRGVAVTPYVGLVPPRLIHPSHPPFCD